MELRKIIDKTAGRFFFLLASLSTVIIFLIFIFLFKESASLFGERQMEFGTRCVVHPDNPVKKISGDQLFDIQNEIISNWFELGWRDHEIILVDDDAAEDMEEGTALAVAASNPWAVGIVFEDDLEELMNSPERNSVREIEVGKISMGGFLFGKRWKPTATPVNLFGMIPLIIGSMWVTISAVLFAVPISLGCAVFVAEVANDWTREILKPVIEILAGVPSVVFGFFGLLVVVPAVKSFFDINTGETALSGAIMLGIMCFPTIISISEDAISSVPNSLREASLAVGATRWQTIYKVVLPAARSGIVAAVILGIGRAIGETMTVLMVTGNAPMIGRSILEPARTLTATIASELGEAPQNSSHYFALFGVASVLFFITIAINLTADIIINQSKKV
ncbi:MAG: phosphate ABC transporter permease subunit PstC [bacterium]